MDGQEFVGEIAWENSVGRERDGSDDKVDGREPWEIP